ncbi:MAG: hypothetical protein IJ677_03660, partial [Alphaproteobacteria bacterium]|nr:hypothetical protein [Alphaproteobacteria bacterium]
NQLSKNKIKMAANTLKRYWNEKDLPMYKRLFYFMQYATNGVRKRICRSSNTNIVSDKDFNCKQY